MSALGCHLTWRWSLRPGATHIRACCGQCAPQRLTGCGLDIINEMPLIMCPVTLGRPGGVRARRTTRQCSKKSASTSVGQGQSGYEWGGGQAGLTFVHHALQLSHIVDVLLRRVAAAKKRAGEEAAACLQGTCVACPDLEAATSCCMPLN